MELLRIPYRGNKRAISCVQNAGFYLLRMGNYSMWLFVFVTAIIVTVRIQGSLVTTVRKIFLNVPLIPVSMELHVWRG